MCCAHSPRAHYAADYSSAKYLLTVSAPTLSQVFLCAIILTHTSAVLSLFVAPAPNQPPPPSHNSLHSLPTPCCCCAATNLHNSALAFQVAFEPALTLKPRNSTNVQTSCCHPAAKCCRRLFIVVAGELLVREECGAGELQWQIGTKLGRVATASFYSSIQSFYCLAATCPLRLLCVCITLHSSTSIYPSTCKLFALRMSPHQSRLTQR